MIRRISDIALRSIGFYRKHVLYQFLIIVLLSAVITGSLLTGSSVRNSLKAIASEKLGKTEYVISSGNRYISTDLSRELFSKGIKGSGFLDIKGSVSNLISQQSVNGANIYFIENGFFPFINERSITIDPGTVIVNEKLASRLSLKAGDDVIIRFRNLSDIPADAPFAPSEEDFESVVLKIGRVVDGSEGGNFSLGINQVVPHNVFVNFSDLEKVSEWKPKHNRVITGGENDKIAEILSEIIKPVHTGLITRVSSVTGESELISERIFIDSLLAESIMSVIPESSPAITYLANSIRFKDKMTPYSFVTALDSSVCGLADKKNGIIINRWLSDDLEAQEGDSLVVSWYTPDSLNHLIEKQQVFIVEKIVEMKGIWADSLLMPDFPGISGKESCTQWDAGVQIDTRVIRDKDEQYWNNHKGTPKAFINYETGRRIWGNSLGISTSIRFQKDIQSDEVTDQLTGNIDPSLSGITIRNILSDSIEAADESVDFGTLFISLGFFLILACFILLWLTVAGEIENRKYMIRVLYSTGYRRSKILHILLIEFFIIAFAGCLAGSVAGYFFNSLITSALNSVWSGAVQVNTLRSYFDLTVIVTGFLACFFILCVFLYILVSIHLKRYFQNKSRLPFTSRIKKVWMLLVITAVITTILILFSITDLSNIPISFLSGVMLLITALVLFWYLMHVRNSRTRLSGYSDISALYYAKYPSQGILPVLLISTGIFAFMITVVNRKDFSSLNNERSSGTGGFDYWIECTIPLSEDITRLIEEDEKSCQIEFIGMKKQPGNDASCLNLNHITTPPLLGVNPADLLRKEAFSFARHLKNETVESPWEYLSIEPGKNSVYAIADQTVLDWGLKIGIGDTLIIRAENGQPLNVIIAAGLQSSVFQGYLIIGSAEFRKYFPSVTGQSVFLAESGNPVADNDCIEVLNDRLSMYGTETSSTVERLTTFYQITNTYLSVFGVFGGFGMIIGIAGLGLVLVRNYTNRKKEFALMLATGFSFRTIKRVILSEQVKIMVYGITTGIISAIIATMPSLNSGNDIPWLYIAIMIVLIFISGITALFLSVKSIEKSSLINSLRKE